MNESSNKKIKTVFVLPALTAGGAERVLITLMNNLDRLRFDPLFVTVSDEGSLRDIIDTEIPFYSLKGRRVTRSLPKLYSKLKEIKPDIVVTTMAHLNLAVLLLKPFFPKTRFIVREAITPSFILDENKRISPFLKIAYKTLYSSADRVISPAQAIIDEFHDVLGMNCKNHQLLYNPVDLQRIRAEENKSFEVTEKRKRTIQFVAAGRLHHQKGYDQLIESLSGLNIQLDWQLSILGEGPERETLEALISKHKLENRVSLLGLFEKPWPEYAEADCFLLPSRWEGLPNVVLESLACGTPVIATKDSGGIKEIEAQSKKGSVTVVDDMEMFIEAMAKVNPTPSNKFRPSLLPDSFNKERVVEYFEQILCDVCFNH